MRACVCCEHFAKEWFRKKRKKEKRATAEMDVRNIFNDSFFFLSLQTLSFSKNSVSCVRLCLFFLLFGSSAAGVRVPLSLAPSKRAASLRDSVDEFRGGHLAFLLRFIDAPYLLYWSSQRGLLFQLIVLQRVRSSQFGLERDAE